MGVRCQRGGPAWAVRATVLVLLVALSTVEASTVVVDSGRALVEAIADATVDRVVVSRPLLLVPQDFPSGHVIRLNRNLTITSEPAGPHMLIDFNARDVRNKISIGPGYNLSLVHLTVKDTRYGPGADVDILAASPDGLLYLTDTAKLQTSCPPLKKKAILDYVRDPTVPGVNDIGFPPTTVWEGVTYADPIVYKDFSTRMSLGENAADRGYVVHKRYSWKLCAKVIDPECVAQADVATCVQQDQDAAYFATRPQSPAPSTGLSAGAKAGVAVAAVAVGLIVLVGAALLVRRARNHASISDNKPPLLPTNNHPKHMLHRDGSGGSGSGSGSNRGGAGSSGDTRRSTSLNSTPHSSMGDSAMENTTFGKGGVAPPAVAAPVQGSSCSSGSVALLKPRVSGVLPTIVRGTLSAEQASTVHLGQLIGCGSFGRVFAGRLGQQDVAIKVVHHDEAAASQVASEVCVAMQFDNVHLVKAHHFVTWGSAGLSQRLTCPDKGQLDDAMRLRSDIDSGSAGIDSGSVSSGGSRPQHSATSRLPRMLESWVVYEICNAGNLQDAVMLRDQSVFFAGDIPQIGIMLQTLLGVAKGMACLHSRNVLHGDLKAANVLLGVTEAHREAADTGNSSSNNSSSSGNNANPSDDLGGLAELTAKVSDFGLSRMMREGASHHSTHTMGTITHQAPELMKSGRLSKAADVFSFGVMMWEVFMAAHPWKGLTMGEVMHRVMMDNSRLIWGTGVPKGYATLAEQCWQADHEARPTFVQVVAALQAMLDQHETLQTGVDKAYRRIGTFD